MTFAQCHRFSVVLEHWYSSATASLNSHASCWAITQPYFFTTAWFTWWAFITINRIRSCERQSSIMGGEKYQFCFFLSLWNSQIFDWERGCLRLKALYVFENQILKSEMVIFRGRIFYIGKNANPISMVRMENRVLLPRKTFHKHSCLCGKLWVFVFFGWGLLCFCGCEVSCLSFVSVFFQKFGWWGFVA